MDKVKNKEHYAYLVVSAKKTIYTGSTNDLRLAVYRHRTKEMPGRHEPKRLVYFETFATKESAKHRAAQIKRLSRTQKIDLINSTNPSWSELLP